MSDTIITNQNEPRKKVLIETWGCQMNVADSEQMLGMLHKENYESTTEPDDADLRTTRSEIKTLKLPSLDASHRRKVKNFSSSRML